MRSYDITELVNFVEQPDGSVSIGPRDEMRRVDPRVRDAMERRAPWPITPPLVIESNPGLPPDPRGPSDNST